MTIEIHGHRHGQPCTQILELYMELSEPFGYWTLRVDNAIFSSFQDLISHGAAQLGSCANFRIEPAPTSPPVTCSRCSYPLERMYANRVATWIENSRFEARHGTGPEMIPWLCPSCMELFHAFMDGRAIGEVPR